MLENSIGIPEGNFKYSDFGYYRILYCGRTSIEQKKIIKIRTEINGIENRKTIEKINETKDIFQKISIKLITSVWVKQ